MATMHECPYLSFPTAAMNALDCLYLGVCNRLRDHHVIVDGFAYRIEVQVPP